MEDKVIRHPILRKCPIIIVDKMSNWANGSIVSEVYYQKVRFKGKPLNYILIERDGAIREHGSCDYSVIGATIALEAGHEKYPMNPKLALRWAVKEAIKKEQGGPLNVLKAAYEKHYGEFPYFIENSSADWKSPYQMDKPGDKARPDEWAKIKDMMDQEADDEDEE